MTKENNRICPSAIPFPSIRYPSASHFAIPTFCYPFAIRSGFSPQILPWHWQPRREQSHLGLLDKDISGRDNYSAKRLHRPVQRLQSPEFWRAHYPTSLPHIIIYHSHPRTVPSHQKTRLTQLFRVVITTLLQSYQSTISVHIFFHEGSCLPLGTLEKNAFRIIN